MNAWRLLATMVLVSAPLVVDPPPAAAGSGRCPAGTGVTVVVDYGALGGGVQVGCDRSGGGDPASAVSPRAGFPLDYVSNEPGFVCAVASKPDPQASCGRTPPSDAYWGLFWSDGSPATWSYSSEGARTLDVRAGGSIGWRWQDGGELERPGASPTARPAPRPKPDPKPSPAEAEGSGTTGTPGSTATSGASTPTPQARSSATVSPSTPASARSERRRDSAGGSTADREDDDKAGKRERRDKSAERERAAASEDPSVTDSAAAPVEQVEQLSDTSDDTDSTRSMLPLLVGGLVALGLGTYAAVAAWRRRV